MDSPKVVLATHLSDERIAVGKKVVILGGGLVGCESAVHLATKGKGRHRCRDDEGRRCRRQRPPEAILLDMLAKRQVKVETRMKALRSPAKDLSVPMKREGKAL